MALRDLLHPLKERQRQKQNPEPASNRQRSCEQEQEGVTSQGGLDLLPRPGPGAGLCTRGPAGAGRARPQRSQLLCHPPQPRVAALAGEFTAPRGLPPRAGSGRCPLPAARRPYRGPPRGADPCRGPGGAWRARAVTHQLPAGARPVQGGGGPGALGAARFEFGARRGASPVTCRPAPVSGGGGGAGPGQWAAAAAGTDVRAGPGPGRAGTALCRPCTGTAAPARPWQCRQLPSTMLPAAGSPAVRPGRRQRAGSW